MTAFFLACLAAWTPDACADSIMNAMGGEARWNATRYIAFDFAVVSEGKELFRHHHLWDKWTGRYRIEGKNRAGQNYRIFFSNIYFKSGRAIVDGIECGADSLPKFLDYGYARFINDTYWLLAPWKLKDPGVHLASTGDCEIQLTFDNVGLTPGDTYWMTADSKTKLLTKWRFKLEDGGEGEYLWSQWVERGGLRFSEIKTTPDGRRSVHTEAVRVFDSLNDSAFSPDSDFPK